MRAAAPGVCLPVRGERPMSAGTSRKVVAHPDGVKASRRPSVRPADFRARCGRPVPRATSADQATARRRPRRSDVLAALLRQSRAGRAAGGGGCGACPSTTRAAPAAVPTATAATGRTQLRGSRIASSSQSDELLERLERGRLDIGQPALELVHEAGRRLHRLSACSSMRMISGPAPAVRACRPAAVIHLLLPLLQPQLVLELLDRAVDQHLRCPLCAAEGPCDISRLSIPSAKRMIRASRRSSGSDAYSLEDCNGLLASRRPDPPCRAAGRIASMSSSAVVGFRLRSR